MIYVSIDIETCGLDWNEDSTIEFGAIVEDTRNQLPFDELPSFSRLLSHRKYVGTPKALSMHQEIFDELSRSPEHRKTKVIDCNDLGYQFRDWLISLNLGFPETKDHCVIINVAGKNFGTFDLRFLENLPEFKMWVWFKQRIIDPGVLYYDPFLDEELPNLSTCKARAGLSDLKIAHRTLADALDVINVLRGKLYPVQKKDNFFDKNTLKT